MTSPAPPTDELATLVGLAADELAVLWPRLADALERDARGLGTSDGRPSAPDVHAALANREVADAITVLAAAAADAADRVATALAAGGRWTGPAPTAALLLADAAHWYDALRRHGGDATASWLAGQLDTWVRAARTALRLTTRERPLGRRCPYHRDRPAGLLVEADEARLHDALLAGRTVPPGQAPLSWRHADAVRCPDQTCPGQRWQGAAQLRQLSKLLDAADATEQRTREAHR